MLKLLKNSLWARIFSVVCLCVCLLSVIFALRMKTHPSPESADGGDIFGHRETTLIDAGGQANLVGAPVSGRNAPKCATQTFNDGIIGRRTDVGLFVHINKQTTEFSYSSNFQELIQRRPSITHLTQSYRLVSNMLFDDPRRVGNLPAAADIGVQPPDMIVIEMSKEDRYGVAQFSQLVGFLYQYFDVSPEMSDDRGVLDVCLVFKGAKTSLEPGGEETTGTYSVAVRIESGRSYLRGVLDSGKYEAANGVRTLSRFEIQSGWIRYLATGPFQSRDLGERMWEAHQTGKAQQPIYEPCASLTNLEITMGIFEEHYRYAQRASGKPLNEENRWMSVDPNTNWCCNRSVG